MSNSEFERTESIDDYRLLVQSITDYAIYRLSPSGTITSWNEGAQRTKGYSSSEVIGQHFSLFFTSEDRADGKPEKALAVARTTGRYHEEGWRVRKGGARFWASVVIDRILDEDGKLVGFAKITRDLTESRATQDTLRQTERRFRLLMDSVVHYAIYTIDPEGWITSWNPGAERAKGYSSGEILGQNFARFYTPEDQAIGKPAKALATARETGRFEEEGWRVRKDGTRFWAHIVVEPMSDEDGQFIGFAKITRDISETLALEAAKEQLYQAQKMETVGQLTGGVAHDFNNLLAVIMGSLELIPAAKEGDKVQRLVQAALRAAQRGANLTTQLLAFSRRQVLRPQVSNVNALIRSIEPLLRQEGKNTVDFQLNLSADLGLSNVDQAQFQSTLMNLVGNARDAMPTGGLITVETRNILVDPRTAAALTEIVSGPYVLVVVRDTGEGMTPEVKARAIEPFYTTKIVGKGSGLGLSQVYGFVRQSNGQMTIASEIGRGTSVTIYLPAFAGAIRDNLATKGGRQDTDSLATILAVEDDPDVLEIAVEAIQGFGYNVHPARGASEALKYLQLGSPVDVLFTDIVMPPGMNGVELARNAVQLRPSLRVLLASGYPRDAPEMREALAQSEMAFIAKPYTLTALQRNLGLLTVPDQGRHALVPH